MPSADPTGYLEELLRRVLELTEASVARECWSDAGAVSADPQWWYGYRQALRDLSWRDG